MPEEQARPAAQHAPHTATVSDSSNSTGATSLALPIVDAGEISLRITIDFQLSPSSSGGGLKVSPRATEGGSEDTKGIGDQTFEPEPETTG